MPDDVKMVLVIRRIPGTPRGKEIAQGAHAAMAWLTRRLDMEQTMHLWRGGDHPISQCSRQSCGSPKRSTTGFVTLTEPELAWVTGRFRKVTLQVHTLEELLELDEKAAAAGIEHHLITDAGLSVYKEPTVTALGLGPAYDRDLDPITGHLKTY